jgi:hypothetical protein
MSKKQNGRKIRIEYHYDRLSNRKIAQIYKLLVPNVPNAPKVPEPISILSLPSTSTGIESGNGNDKIEKGGNLNENEDNGDLCPGFVKQTKRGKNHR